MNTPMGWKTVQVKGGKGKGVVAAKRGEVEDRPKTRPAPVIEMARLAQAEPPDCETQNGNGACKPTYSGGA